MCLGVGGRCDICIVCKCDCVCGCVDTGLAVNGNAVESWNMSNDCTELISQAMFYDFIFIFLLLLCCIV